MNNNSGIPTNVAATLSYLFVPAIIFMVLQPYKDDKVIRRHAYHALAISLAMVIVGIGISMLCMVPGVNMLMVPVSMAYSLAALALCIMLMLKAYQGSILQLPVLTDLADKYSAA